MAIDMATEHSEADDMEALRTSRQATLSSTPLSLDVLKQRDATLKKTTAAIRKLRLGITQETVSPLLSTDLVRLNLTRHLSEAVDALSDTVFRTRPSDLPAWTSVVCLLHTTYKGFGQGLMQQLKTQISPILEVPATEEKEMLTPKRMALRILVALYIAGVYEDRGNAVEGVIKTFSKNDAMSSKMSVKRYVTTHAHLSLFNGFLKTYHAQILELLPEDLQTRWLSPLRTYFNTCVETLINEHMVYRDLLARYDRTVGTAKEMRHIDFELYATQFQKLRESVEVLAGHLKMPIPSLDDSSATSSQKASTVSVSHSAEQEAARVNAAQGFDDTVTYEFYRQLIDLYAILPPNTLDSAENPSPVGESTADIRAIKQEKFETLGNACLSRESTDAQCRQFCTETFTADGQTMQLNTPENRKLLVSFLVEGADMSIKDKIPYYARFISTLDRQFGKIGRFCIITHC